MCGRRSSPTGFDACSCSASGQPNLVSGATPRPRIGPAPSPRHVSCFSLFSSGRRRCGLRSSLASFVSGLNRSRDNVRCCCPGVWWWRPSSPCLSCLSAYASASHPEIGSTLSRRCCWHDDDDGALAAGRREHRTERVPEGGSLASMVAASPFLQPAGCATAPICLSFSSVTRRSLVRRMYVTM